MKRLRELREASGLSQFAAANRSGLDRTRLALAEAGHVHLTPQQERTLRRVLQVALRKRVAHLQSVLDAIQPRQSEQLERRLSA